MLSEIAPQIHARKFFPVSARDAALNREIQDLDRQWMTAVLSGEDTRFVQRRLLARRNDLSREQAHEWRIASLGKIPA